MAPTLAIPLIQIPERENSQDSDDSDYSDFGDHVYRFLLGHPMPPEGFVGGRSEEGFAVPDHGGYLCQEDVRGHEELWIDWTNYPAAYWNEWHCIREVADENGNHWFQQWWYGEWI